MKGIERAKEFLKMYKEGKTHREIGEKYSISKTRVSVELHKYFSEELKNITKNRNWYVGIRKKAEFTTFTCLNCKKTQTSKYKNYVPKFCNKECQGEFMKKVYAKQTI